jgi:hypothetical protein
VREPAEHRLDPKSLKIAAGKPLVIPKSLKIAAGKPLVMISAN